VTAAVITEKRPKQPHALNLDLPWSHVVGRTILAGPEGLKAELYAHYRKIRLCFTHYPLEEVCLGSHAQ